MTKTRSVTCSEAAEMLGMDKNIMSRWVRTGRCPFAEYITDGSKSRGHYFIHRARLERYITGEDMTACPYAGAQAPVLTENDKDADYLVQAAYERKEAPVLTRLSPGVLARQAARERRCRTVSR
jgi:hypothetical protein